MLVFEALFLNKRGDCADAVQVLLEVKEIGLRDTINSRLISPDAP
jgi:hypothetical protein